MHRDAVIQTPEVHVGRIGRNTANLAKRAVQPDHHRRQRLVKQRHDHPKPRPRQPPAEQHRPPPDHDRSVPVVPLQPQPRPRDARPRPPPCLPPAALGLRDRPPHRPVRPLIAHRDQHPVHNISPDVCARKIHQLIDLLRKRVHQRPTARPHRQPTRGLPRCDQPRDRTCRGGVGLLKEQGVDGVVTVGATIPPTDLAELKARGVAELLTPGASTSGRSVWSAALCGL